MREQAESPAPYTPYTFLAETLVFSAEGYTPRFDPLHPRGLGRTSEQRRKPRLFGALPQALRVGTIVIPQTIWAQLRINPESLKPFRG